jgi:single-stranded-DNA-specific exonuclease
LLSDAWRPLTIAVFSESLARVAGRGHNHFMVTASMGIASRRWAVAEDRAAEAAELAALAGVSPVVARLLLARGIETAADAERFLNPKIEHLLDPYTMLGMAAAVARVQAGVRDGECILIYGDYDVDGTTAIVLLKTAIEMLGGVVRFHVPHRLREGYGMQRAILAEAAETGVRLVISVDTGIRAMAEAEAAEQLGLDLIVTDHHLPEPGTLPRALAVLNPNQPGCDYACKHLCGAGVAFKLAQALLEAHDLERARGKILPSFLKMVAIATIADAVPLVGENRVFASIGMEQLRRPVHPGLRALFALAKLDPAKRRLTATDIAFRIAPRINASGRMDVATDVVEMFTTRDAARARELAEKLDGLNTDRRAEEAAILKKIEERLEEDGCRDALCLVLDGDGWHRGIIGILASRVVELTGRPTLVVSNERGRDEDAGAGQSYGSGRSVPGFHLLDAIESCRDLFTRYGGHAHAVGFSLPSERVAELRERVAAYAASHLTADCLEDWVSCDAELPLAEITPALHAELRRMEPMGMGNEEPVFVARGLRLASAPRVVKERHVKLDLVAAPNGVGRSARFSALGWHWAEPVAAMGLGEGSVVDLAYRLRENEHPDFGGLELEIVALELSGNC